MKKFLSVILILTVVFLAVGCKSEVEEIELREDEITLVVGDTYKVRYDINPSDAEYDLDWESDNTDVALVSQKGRITAVGAGRCYITVEAENGVDAEIEVIVEPRITEEELAIVGSYQFLRGNINGTYYYDTNLPNMTLTLCEDKTGVIYYNGSEYRSFTWEYDFSGDSTIYFDAILSDGTIESIWHYPSEGEIWYSFSDGSYAIFKY